MLAFLLDQNISVEVAEQVRAKRPEIKIVSLYEWRSGSFVGAADPLILRAAAEDASLSSLMTARPFRPCW